MTTTAAGSERYLVDAQGKRIAVQLDIAEYQRLLQQIAELEAELAEERSGITYHPRSPDASIEKLEEVLGSIRLTGPVPSHKFMEVEDEDD